MARPIQPLLEFVVEPPRGGVGVVRAIGELHLSTAAALSDQLRAVLADGTSRLVVDLSDLHFIDSTGLSVLLTMLRETERQGGAMAIVCANPTVLRLFDITGTERTLHVERTREAALKAVGAA